MTSTLNPACPLCGLRSASKPLPALRIREDHRPQPAASTLAAAGRPRRRLAHPRRPGLACRPSRTGKEVTAMTATRLPRLGLVVTVSRRVLRGLRYADDELMRASEAIIRSSRAPQSRPRIQATAARDTHPDTATGHADRAA